MRIIQQQRTKRFRTLVIFVMLLMAGSFSFHQHFQSEGMTRRLLEMNARSQSLSEQLGALQTDTAAMNAELGRLKVESGKWEDHHEELMTLRDTISRRHVAGSVSTALSMDKKGVWLKPAARAWTDKLLRLKQKFAESVELQIPEMELVTGQDWIDVTKTDMVTEEDCLRALGRIREIGERKASLYLNKALAKYLKATGKAFPSDVGQLSLFLENPLNQDILDRWAVYSRSNFPAIRANGEYVISQKYPGTTKYDHRFYFNEHSNGSFP